MTSPKKPGVAFWATVVVVVGLVAYSLSFGPACRLANLHLISTDAIRHGYKPILRIMDGGPRPVQSAIRWFAGFSDGKITHLELALECLARS
jgi:hypothetical protein